MDFHFHWLVDLAGESVFHDGENGARLLVQGEFASAEAVVSEEAPPPRRGSQEDIPESEDRPIGIRVIGGDGFVFGALEFRGLPEHFPGDEFSLENLQTKYDEIMSMNVTPSTQSDLLDVKFDSDGNMTDASGNYVEDTRSITSGQYYASLPSGQTGNNSDEGGYEYGNDSEE